MGVDAPQIGYTVRTCWLIPSVLQHRRRKGKFPHVQHVPGYRRSISSSSTSAVTLPINCTKYIRSTYIFFRYTYFQIFTGIVRIGIVLRCTVCNCNTGHLAFSFAAERNRATISCSLNGNESKTACGAGKKTLLRGRQGTSGNHMTTQRKVAEIS